MLLIVNDDSSLNWGCQRSEVLFIRLQVKILVRCPQLGNLGQLSHCKGPGSSALRSCVPMPARCPDLFYRLSQGVILWVKESLQQSLCHIVHSRL